MDNLWKKEFHASRLGETPDSIIQAQCDFLQKMTDGKIIAKCVSYDGYTKSYKVNSSFEQVSKMLQPKLHDIQNDLGEIEETRFAYEFYITCRTTPNYKYRIMFIEYGFMFYPVSITLDEDIASEISIETDIECDTQEDFNSVLEKVLNSSKLEKLINNLLTLVDRHEAIPGL